MYLKQISVFVENKPGRMADIAEILTDNGINIEALSIADTTDFGILRMIADKYNEAVAALKAAGITVRVTDVVGVPIEDKPGGLSKILSALDEKGISIEYLYAFPARNCKEAWLVLSTDRPEDTINALNEKGIGILTPGEVGLT